MNTLSFEEILCCSNIQSNQEYKCVVVDAHPVLPGTICCLFVGRCMVCSLVLLQNSRKQARP